MGRSENPRLPPTVNQQQQALQCFKSLRRHGAIQTDHDIAFAWLHKATSSSVQLIIHVAMQVNLITGEGLAECFDGGRQFDAVVNTAAISQPALCERDPSMAR